MAEGSRKLSDASSPVLVGRQNEIERLKKLLGRACNGKGVAAIILGDPGIGKTRLAGAIGAEAAEKRVLTLHGRCLESTQNFAYGALLDALRSFYAGRAPDEIARFMGTTAIELVKIAPELASLLPDLAPAESPDTAQQKDRVFQALTRLFTRIAAVQPLMIVVENLQWCDETSSEFLLTLAFRISSHPVFLLMTCSTDRMPHYVEHMMLRLGREARLEQIRLGPMTREETGLMLKAIFGLERPIRPEFLESIYGLTEGNPAFIEETARSLIAVGKNLMADERWDGKMGMSLPIPPAAREAARDRARNLSPFSRQLLNIAAVIGRRFNFSFLQGLVQRDEAELLSELKELIAAQLVVENSVEEFSFRDTLTRRAIYSELMARERKSLHTAIAKALEERSTEQWSGRVSELAFHYYDAEDWNSALLYSAQAGKAALASYAPRTALRHYTRALNAAQRLSISPPPDVIRERGLAYQTIGHFEAARQDFETALNQIALSPKLETQAQSLLDLGAVWASHDISLASTFDRQAMDLVRDNPGLSLKAAAFNHIGNRLASAEEPTVACEYHRRAFELAEQTNDDRARMESLKGMGFSFYVAGDWSDAAMWLGQAAELADRLGDRHSIVSSTALLVESAAEPPNDLAELGEKALRSANDSGWRSGVAMTLLAMASFNVRLGDYSRALQFAQDGLNVAEEIEHRLWILLAHFTQGLIFADLFLTDRAVAEFELALRLAKEVHSTFWLRQATAMLAHMHTLRREFAPSDALLTPLVLDHTISLSLGFPSGQEHVPLGDGKRLLDWARAELALTRGDAQSAVDIAQSSLRMDRAPESRSQMLLSLLHAKAQMAIGQCTQARDLAQRTLAIAVEQSNRPLEWQSRVLLGQALHELRNERGAQSEFAAARDLVEELTGKVPDQEMASNYSAFAMSQIPSLPQRRQSRDAFGGLTPRELEVAALVAGGQSNRKIAQSLTITERTVKTHIANIMSKLDFESRAQIARWAVEIGLVKPSH